MMPSHVLVLHANPHTRKCLDVCAQTQMSCPRRVGEDTEKRRRTSLYSLSSPSSLLPPPTLKTRTRVGADAFTSTSDKMPSLPPPTQSFAHGAWKDIGL
jgi:hypothetical protein